MKTHDIGMRKLLLVSALSAGCAEDVGLDVQSVANIPCNQENVRLMIYRGAGPTPTDVCVSLGDGKYAWVNAWGRR